ncbi:hypothetical protein N0V90_010580 [Kalmusia sp. IMI 367209]|nr:hypothetical protein N0V90_010580 [Kalmusia sp. IMI 367209]
MRPQASSNGDVEISVPQKVIASLTQERDEWKAKAEVARRSIEEDRKELVRHDVGVIRATSTDTVSLLAKIAGLEANNQALKLRMADLLDKYTEADGEVERLKACNGQLMERLREMGSLEVKKKYLESLAQDAEGTSASLNNKIKLQDNEMKELRARLQREKSEAYQARKDIVDLRRKLAAKLEGKSPFMELQDVLVRLPESNAQSSIFAFPITFKIDVDDFGWVKETSRWWSCQQQVGKAFQAWYDLRKKPAQMNLREQESSYCESNFVFAGIKEWWSEYESDGEDKGDGDEEEEKEYKEEDTKDDSENGVEREKFQHPQTPLNAQALKSIDGGDVNSMDSIRKRCLDYFTRLEERA